MKTMIGSILTIFLLLFILGCEEQQDNSRPRSPYMVDVRFVDEVGNNLLDRVQLKEGSYGSFAMASTQYQMLCVINGKDFRRETHFIPAYPQSGTITIPCSGPMGGNVDSLWIYTLKFTCPELFGNDREHIFVIEKKERNFGLLNNFERLLFDGKVIATNMEGDGSDNDRLPVVIVVPQK